MLSLTLVFALALALNEGSPTELIPVNLTGPKATNISVLIARQDLRALIEEQNSELAIVVSGRVWGEEIRIKIQGTKTTDFKNGNRRVRIKGSGLVAHSALAERMGQASHWNGWQNRSSLG